jgi:hypothetical protein
LLVPDERIPMMKGELPEKTEAAMREAIVDVVDDQLSFNVSAYGQAWTQEHKDTEFVVADSAARAAERAMDPALGPDRLVVAGLFEQEVIEKVCAFLTSTHPAYMTRKGKWDLDDVADAIAGQFGVARPEGTTCDAHAIDRARINADKDRGARG